MRLEDVSAVIRPRGQWESVDLGFAMVRRHFPRLITAWFLTVVPLWIVLLALSPYITLGWSLTLIWWLKPVYDRVPLFILSRSLFGAMPTYREVLREWPKMLFRRIFWLLFFRIPWLIVLPHFAWSRALTQTAIDLEQQRGKPLKDRQQVLLRLAGGRVGWLMAICALYEMMMICALFCIGAMFNDETNSASELVIAFFETSSSGVVAPWLEWSMVGCYLVSMTLVELFYVGGGFGIYLNCRTQLEGWDVEITFRRLAKRMQKVVTAFAFLALSSVAFGAELEKADEPEKTEKETIQEVMKHKDFEVMKETYREYEDTKSNNSGGNWNWSFNTDWLGAIGQVLYWVIIAGAIGWLIWIIYMNRHLFQRGAVGNVIERKGPRTIMGMDVTPESLPADIVGAARACWAAGDARGALSLLYRGSLSWLVHHDKLPVQEGDTEGDCVRYTRKASEPVRRDYFADLTGQWVLVAYGERPPTPDAMERLLSSFPFRTGGGVA